MNDELIIWDNDNLEMVAIDIKSGQKRVVSKDRYIFCQINQDGVCVSRIEAEFYEEVMNYYNRLSIVFILSAIILFVYYLNAYVFCDNNEEGARGIMNSIIREYEISGCTDNNYYLSDYEYSIGIDYHECVVFFPDENMFRELCKINFSGEKNHEFWHQRILPMLETFEKESIIIAISNISTDDSSVYTIRVNKSDPRDFSMLFINDERKCVYIKNNM